MMNYLRNIVRKSVPNQFFRSLCTPTSSEVAEKKLTDILQNKFPDAEEVKVSDMSGGCGAMYEVTVVSKQFQGIRSVQQHRLVTEALKEEIKDMHGIRIFTDFPR